jgi:hypothetical protein
MLCARCERVGSPVTCFASLTWAGTSIDTRLEDRLQPPHPRAMRQRWRRPKASYEVAINDPPAAPTATVSQPVSRRLKKEKPTRTAGMPTRTQTRMVMSGSSLGGEAKTTRILQIPYIRGCATKPTSAPALAPRRGLKESGQIITSHQARGARHPAASAAARNREVTGLTKGLTSASSAA